MAELGSREARRYQIQTARKGSSMASISARLTDGQVPFPRAQVWPYVDTIEVYFAVLRPEQRQRLRRDWWLRRCRHGFGYKLICNQSSKKERKRLTPSRLRRLDTLCDKFHGVVSRVDVALDIQVDDPVALHQQIRAMAILRWKINGSMFENGDTTYWEPLKSGKPLRRNLVLYSDRHNRITGELDSVHFELRLYQAQVVRNQGITRPSDLLRINPRLWFNKHVKWSSRA